MCGAQEESGKMKPLLFATAAAILFLASPALAGWTHWVVPGCWACGAYEHAHRCNAELNVRTHRCGCLVR
jgi:hypothetical protein